MMVSSVNCLFFSITFQQILAFYQDDYIVKVDIVDLTWYDPTYIKNASLSRCWYNRTTRVLCGDGMLLKDLEMHIKIDLQSYKFMSNEYRFFPVTMTFDGCTERFSHNFGIKELFDQYTNLGYCPFKKGHYYMRKMYIDFSKFPPYIPRGQYKLQAKFYNNRDYFMEVNVYHTVEENKKWKK